MFKNLVDAPNPDAGYAETLAFNMYAEETSRKEAEKANSRKVMLGLAAMGIASSICGSYLDDIDESLF